jgi:hypothetical protein
MTTVKKVRPSRAVCMPVGPLGVKPATVQLLAALVKLEGVDALFLHQGHLIPARNKAWACAVEKQAKRVLWIDSDIYAAPSELLAFMERADRVFDAPGNVDAWIGAVCARRGGGWAMQLSRDAGKYPVLLGLGLAYWDVAAMSSALGEAETAFTWVPPFGEDYAACAKVWDAGLRVAVDALLPTDHEDVGSWPGGSSTKAVDDAS